MKGQTVFGRLLGLLWLIVGSSALAACTPDTLQVGFEPTAGPPSTLAPSPTPPPSVMSYRNETHGFAFSYQSTWTLAESPNEIVLSQGTLTLRVGYRWKTEAVDISGRTGVPAGDFIYRGKVQFLDQVIPARALEFERRDKAVFYGESSLVEAGDLAFSIWLDDSNAADYAGLDIAQEIQNEAIAILESFHRVGATTQPPSLQATPSPSESLATFIDDTYGLTFQYPADWTIQEQGPRFVRLGLEPLSLYIGYMWLYESVDIWNRTGIPAGEMESRDTVSILDQELTRNVLVQEGRDLVVFYGPAGSVIQAGDIALAIYLDDLSPGGSAGIPQDFQAAADQVVESLILLPGEPPVTDLAVVGWYGSVHSLPATARFDDYLALLPYGAGAVGLAGASEAVEAEIEALRDNEEPGKFAHFWGSLNCGISDYGGCQLLVTHLRPDGPGPFLNPDPVEAWEGTMITTSAWAQIDDAFVLSGNYPVHYGVWSEDPKIAERLESYRNSGVTVRIWGQVTCGVMDANGCQIVVNRLEEIPGPAESLDEPASWVSYRDEEYGFSFQYPAGWRLDTLPAEPLEGSSGWLQGIALNHNDLVTTIRYLRPSNTGERGWGGWGASAEPSASDTVPFMNGAAFRTIWALQEETKGILVVYAGEEQDLALQITLSSLQQSADYLNVNEAVPIPDSAIVMLDQLLSSFQAIP